MYVLNYTFKIYPSLGDGFLNQVSDKNWMKKICYIEFNLSFRNLWFGDFIKIILYKVMGYY